MKNLSIWKNKQKNQKTRYSWLKYLSLNAFSVRQSVMLLPLQQPGSQISDHILDLEIPLKVAWLLILLSLSFNWTWHLPCPPSMTSWLVHMPHLWRSWIIHLPLLGPGFPAWAHVMGTVVVCYLEWDPPFLSGPGHPFQAPAAFLLQHCPGAATVGQLQATSGHTEEQNQGHTQCQGPFGLL